jgi:hypothetical protein
MSDGNTSSERRRPVVSSNLTPTDMTSVLKQLWWLREVTKNGSEPDYYPSFNQYLIIGQPENLKAFADQFLLEDYLLEDGTPNYRPRLIWTCENSFVRVAGAYWCRDILDGGYQNVRFRFTLKKGSQELSFLIHSKTKEDAMSSLDLLVGLNDEYFDTMEFCYFGFESMVDCPLTIPLLQKLILQNAKRKNSFDGMIFTADQSRTLAFSGRRTDIGIDRCKFEDDGAAFLEASIVARREYPQAGLVNLGISNCLPFAEGILVLFLFQHTTLECLTLCNICLLSEEACRAVSTADLQYLKLDNCVPEDGGASLVESVREGRGPKGLGLFKAIDEGHEAWHPFDSTERFVSFVDALRGNSHLERLGLSDIDVDDGILQKLAAALFENEGLIHLALQNCHLNESSFCELLRAISAHSSLRKLALTGMSSFMDRTEAAKKVAKMLSVNKQLEEIRIDKVTADDFDKDWPLFDPAAWENLVTPRLDCNVYRKRFPAIQKIRLLSTRAAVMARALTHVSNKPWLVWMLVSQNHDILSSYLPDNPTFASHDHQIAIVSRKRDR